MFICKFKEHGEIRASKAHSRQYCVLGDEFMIKFIMNCCESMYSCFAEFYELWKRILESYRLLYGWQSHLMISTSNWSLQDQDVLTQSIWDYKLYILPKVEVWLCVAHELSCICAWWCLHNTTCKMFVRWYMDSVGAPYEEHFSFCHSFSSSLLTLNSQMLLKLLGRKEPNVVTIG